MFSLPPRIVGGPKSCQFCGCSVGEGYAEGKVCLSPKATCNPLCAEQHVSVNKHTWEDGGSIAGQAGQ